MGLLLAINNPGYISKTTYDFDPPIKAMSVQIKGDKYKLRRFAQGLCMGYDYTRESFAFKGERVVDKVVIKYYFYIPYGRKNAANVIQRTHLKLVE